MLAGPMSRLSERFRAHQRWVLVAIGLVALAAAWLALHPRERSGVTLRTIGGHPHVVLQAGQEGTIEPALGRGAALPGGCRYADADIEPSRVVARYACPGRAEPHVLELYVGASGHVINGNTGRFGAWTLPDFPPALRDAVFAGVRARENNFYWQVEGERVEARRAPVPGASAPRSREPISLERLAVDATREPTLWLLGALLFMGAFTARLLRREPRRVAWALAAVVLAGAALRLWLAVEAPMNAHSFSRILPHAMALYRGPMLGWVSGRGAAPIYFTSVQSWSNYALAAAMPLVFFAHARLLLGDARSALAAAALMAFLPMHIRFSRSDVSFIASLIASSFTFVALYGSLTDPSRAWRLLCVTLLPVMSLATYQARPENIIFVALDLGALSLYLNRGVPRHRLIIAGALIASTAAYSAATDLVVRYQRNINDGLSVETLRQAVRIFFDHRYNTLVNAWMTPPFLAPLAAVGAAALWRGGQRRRAVFLLAWLGSFFLVHSYVRPSTVAMQARYHLHLMSPFLMLAAAATPRVLALPRPAQAAMLAWVLLSPAFHAGFIRDVSYTEMHEYAFLRLVRGRIDPSCTVLELGPSVESPRTVNTIAQRSLRMSMSLRRGAETEARVRQLGLMPSVAAGPDALEVFAPPDDFVAHPPACLYYYENAACATHRAGPGRLAPVCEEMHRRFALTLVAEANHRLRPYDDVILRRVVTLPDGRIDVRATAPDGIPVHLALYRVSQRP